MASDQSRFFSANAKRNSRLPVLDRRTTDRKSQLDVTEFRRTPLRSSSNNARRTTRVAPVPGLRRSNSDMCLATPGPSNAYTPLRKSPFSHRKTQLMGDSARKESNENAIKVLEALQDDPTFFSSLNLIAGLRTMTAKQFLMIVNYFILNIFGKPLSLANKTDPTNEIVKFLKDLNCPYPVSKSFLKAPTAPHSYDLSINLLHWLSEFGFTRDQNPLQSLKQLEDKYNSFVADENLLNQDYTKMFHQRVQGGFHIWNNQQEEEFKKVVQELVNEYIICQTQGQAESVAGVKAKVKKIRLESKDLKTIECQIKNEKKYEATEEQYVQLEYTAMQLESKCEKIADELAAVELKWKEKHIQLDGKQKNVDRLKHIVDTQRWSRVELENLKLDVQTQEYQIKKNRENVNRITNNASENQIQLARLIRNKTDAIIKLNDHLTELAKALNQTELANNADDINFTFLLPSACIADIEKTADQLADIDQRHTQLLAQLTSEQNECEKELFVIELTLKPLKITESSKIFKCQEKEEVLLRSKEKSFNENHLKVNKVENLREFIRQARVDTNECGRLLEKQLEYKDQLDNYNEEVLERCETQVKACLKLKDDIADEIDKSSQFLDQLMENNLPPLKRKRIENEHIEKLQQFVQNCKEDMEAGFDAVNRINLETKPRST